METLGAVTEWRIDSIGEVNDASITTAKDAMSSAASKLEEYMIKRMRICFEIQCFCIERMLRHNCCESSVLY